MTPRMSVFAILTALALAFSGTYALAGIGVHVEAAIEHTQEAIDDGAKGDSKEIVTHVMSALGHAREALHEKAIERDRAANKLLHRAIRHLRLAETVWRPRARRQARDQRARRTEEDQVTAARDAARTRARTHGGGMVVAR